MARHLLRYLLLLCCVLLLAGCPQEGGKNGALDRIQIDYSAAIRWGNFEGAYNLIEPTVREEHPLTDIDFSRYKQVQISSYRDLDTRMLPNGDVVRLIEIGVISRHNLTERTVRYQEVWHYDEEKKAWWQMSGLPDLWQGE